MPAKLHRLSPSREYIATVTDPVDPAAYLVLEEQERTALLLHALEGAIMDGLVATLAEVESFHPAPIVGALWHGLATRPGDVAVHYAAMLAFLYGKAESTFDGSLRPLFLKFNTPSETERQAALVELHALVGNETP